MGAKRFAMMVVFLCFLGPGRSWATNMDPLRIGTAKIDITPTDLTHLNPMGYGTQTRVHDPIFARVLVMGSGEAMAAIVALDLIETGDTLEVRGRIQKEVGIPIDHIMITASHDHSAPRLGRPTAGSLDKLGSVEFDAYTKVVNDKIVAALKQAKTTMQPARMGISTGSVDVNVNRELYTPQGWKEGFNPNGVSDKTVWVLKFETMAGEPIAVLFNYAMHPVVTISENQLSGDVSGAAERYVEHHFGDKVVALWTLGSAGDQIPRFIGEVGRNETGPADAPMTKGNGPDAFEAMNAEGFMIGAEVVRVANLIQPKTTEAKITAGESVFTCPVRESVKKLRTYHENAANTVPIRLGVLLVGNIAFAAVSGEISTSIYHRLRTLSPFNNTILLSVTNDRTGYFLDDATYDTNNFEVTATPAERGCAENGIVEGLLNLMATHR